MAHPVMQFQIISKQADQTAAFDRDLSVLLAARYPEPLWVPHRIFGIVAHKSVERRPSHIDD